MTYHTATIAVQRHAGNVTSEFINLKIIMTMMLRVLEEEILR